MAGHTDFILGVAGQYAISTAVKTMFEAPTKALNFYRNFFYRQRRGNEQLAILAD